MAKQFFTAIISSVLVLSAAMPARAALELQIQETGGPALTIVDNGAGDLNPTVGQISSINPLLFGDFSLSSISASSSRLNPIPGLNLLTSASLDIKNNTPVAHTITLSIGDTDFIATGAPTNVNSTASGTFSVVPGVPSFSVLGSSVTAQTFADPTNAQFGTAIPFENFNFNAPDLPIGSYSNSNVSGFTHTGPYSLTIIDSFTIAGNNQLVGHSDALTVQPIPEPGTCALLGSGVLALVGLIRRRRG